MLLGILWGCTVSSPTSQSSPSISAMSQPSMSWTPQEMMKAKKVVVEIYNKNKKSGGSGFILDILKHRAYILTTSQWLKNYQPPLLVNVFYQGDHPAQLLYQDPRLALLSVEGIHAETFYYLSNEPLKISEPVVTLGFPKERAPWTHQPLVYLKTQGDQLLFSGKVTEGYYGGPLIKEDKIMGIITGQETGFIHALSVETIRNFLKASVPEAKELLARNDQRLSLIVKAQATSQITQKSNLALKSESKSADQNHALVTSLEKKPPHLPLSVSPLRSILLSSLSRPFSPSLTFTHRVESPTSRQSQTIHMTPPLDSLPEAKSPYPPSNFNRKTIKHSPPKPLKSLSISKQPKKTEPSFSVQPGADALVLIDAMCSALETNDTQTFLQIANLLEKSHPLFYLARNLETAFTIHDRKATLQHSIKFLFEAFLLSIRSNHHSSCSQKLIKQKNIELEKLNKTSPQSPTHLK